MDETARISKSLFKRYLTGCILFPLYLLIRKTATKNSVDPTLNSPVAKPVLPSKTTAEMAFEALQRKRVKIEYKSFVLLGSIFE